MRLNSQDDAGTLVRARAVYLIGWAFVATQVLNWGAMYYSYRAYTMDHAVSVLSCVAVLLLTHSLRYHRSFSVIAAFYTMLLFVGVSFSAIPDGTGIHTALIPLIVAGVLMNGFISGWRAVAAYTVFGLGFIWLLYAVSLGAPMVAMGGTGEYFERTFQRAMQCTLVLTLCASIVAMFSLNMYKLFDMLETSLEDARNVDMVKSQFLANMSHELRTPLNGVIGMNELLLRTELDTTQRQYAEIVNGCSNGLITIINDVLDLSKLDAGKITVKFEPFDLRTVVMSLLHLHHPAAMKKGLKLFLNYDEKIPSQFIGDESRLRQVINNLLGNGVKFTETGNVSIFIGGEHLPEGNFALKLVVQDTGIGIAPEDVNSIFGRFEQVDNQLSSNSGGTGLGLAISRELTKLMGGSVEVASEVNKGTAFHVSLEMVLAGEVQVSSSIVNGLDVSSAA